MQVSEIFYSIQGEGINIGKPAVFLRLSGCNLRCGFCDTKYAWKSGQKMDLDQILKAIGKYPVKHLVVTGGEPLLQQSELKELIKNLKDYYIEIETNGTVTPKLNKFNGVYNCSPKVGELKRFPKSKTYYKFVVNEPEDIVAVKKFKFPKDKIILMPRGTRRRELLKKSIWLVEICKKQGFRFSPRLHIDIWGDKKGI